jgi:dynein heavy chain
MLHFQDVSWFIQVSGQLLQEQMGLPYAPEEPYFVDFLRDAPEATGDEDNDSNLDAPKVYEMVGS